MDNLLEREREILKNIERLKAKNEFFKGESEDYRLKLITEFALDLYNSDKKKYNDDKLKFILTRVDDEYSYYLLYKALKNEISLLDETAKLIEENRKEIEVELSKQKDINELVSDIIRDINLVKIKNVFRAVGSVSLTKKDNKLISDGKISRVYVFDSVEDLSKLEFCYNNNLETDFSGSFVSVGDTVLYSDNLLIFKKSLDRIKLIEVGG